MTFFKRLMCMILVLSIISTSLCLILIQPVQAEDVRTMYSNGSLQEIEEILDAMGVSQDDPNRSKLRDLLADRIPALKMLDALEQLLDGNVEKGLEAIGEVLWDALSAINPIAKALDYIKKAVNGVGSYISVFTGNAVQNAYRAYFTERYKAVKGNESRYTKEEILNWIKSGQAGAAKYNRIFEEQIVNNPGMYSQYKDHYKKILIGEAVKNQNISFYEKIVGMRSTRYMEAIKDSNYTDEMIFARMFQDFEYDAVVEGLNQLLFIKAAVTEERINNSYFGLKAVVYLENNKPFANGEVFITPVDDPNELTLVKNLDGSGVFDYSIKLNEFDKSYFQTGREYELKAKSPEFGERSLGRVNLRTMLEKSKQGSGMNWREYDFGKITVTGTQNTEVRININGLAQLAGVQMESILGSTSELISRYSDIPSKFTALFRIFDGNKTVMLSRQVDYNPSTGVSEVNIDLSPKAVYSGGASAIVSNNYLLRSYAISAAEYGEANAAIGNSLSQSDYDYLNSDVVKQQFAETDNILRTNGEACAASISSILTQLNGIDEETALTLYGNFSIDLSYNFYIEDFDRILTNWREKLSAMERVYQEFLSTESTYYNCRMAYESVLDSYNKAVMSGSLPYNALDDMEGVENRLASLENAYAIIRDRQQYMDECRDQIAMLEDYREDRMEIANQTYDRAVTLLSEVKAFDEGEYTAYLNEGWIEKEEKAQSVLLRYISYLNTYMQLGRFNNMDQISGIISDFNAVRANLFTFLKENGKIDNLPATLSDHSAENIQQEIGLILDHTDDFMDIINKNAGMDVQAGEYYDKYYEAYDLFSDDSPVLSALVDKGLLPKMDLTNTGYLSQESKKILTGIYTKNVQYSYYPQITLSKTLIAEAPDSMHPQDVYPVIFNKLKNVYEGRPWDADSTMTFGAVVYQGNNSNSNNNNNSGDVSSGFLNVYLFVQAKKLPVQKNSVINFIDVSNSWAKEYITELSRYGIINGTGNGQFKPKDLVTREQFIKMLLEASGIDVSSIPSGTQSFPDVPASRWSYKYVEAAVYYNLISPREYGVFGFEPDRVLTREEMALLLMRSTGIDELTAETASQVTLMGSYYTDDIAILSKYRGYVILAANNGLMQGNNGMFDPGGTTTREQAATVIYRLIKLNGGQ
ncbi:MAG: S-layer homology domain-containing protein [Thermoclostridium sp.]|nr:S-layer homology domain-containing protein [Thermoclostridium sp.]